MANKSPLVVGAGYPQAISSGDTLLVPALSSSGQITSIVVTGTAPLVIASTTPVSNLNADMVDSKHATDFVQKTDNSLPLTNATSTSISTTTSATTADQVIDTTSSSTFRSVEYLVQITNSTSYHLTKIMIIHDGTDTWIHEYGTLITGSSLASFSADLSGGNIRLLTTPANATTTTFKLVKTAINT